MPGTYTLELELLGIYGAAMPVFEIYEDGAFFNSYSVSSSGTSLSVTINYGGALPSSLQFTFLNDGAEVGRTIEIQSVKINDRYVNTNNYLSTDSLTEGNTSTVDVTSSDYFFEGDPSAATFTVGATQTFTMGNDLYRGRSDTTDEIFDMLAGRDVAYLGSGNDTVSGGADNDTLRGGLGNDLLFGDTGDDRVYGEDGDDELYGGDGNDRVHGGIGNDEIHGGIGNDALNGNDGNDVITGGDGNDRVNGGAGDDFLFGDDGDDIITGAAGADTLDGGAGNDLLFSGLGNDFVNGGDDDDIIYSFDGNDTLSGDDGDDDLYGQRGDDTLRGGIGEDRLYGGDNADDLDGGAGNDIMYGGSGIDTHSGGAGDDFIDGGTEDDTINGDDGNDILKGSADDDTIIGGNGDDFIVGDGGDNLQGWIYKYYDSLSSPSDLATAGFTIGNQRFNSNTITEHGFTNDLDPTLIDGGDDYAVQYTTYLTITTAGTYDFRTRSDDGSMLFLNGVQIVDNDGLHAPTTVTSAGQVLAAGVYRLDATFFERGGGNVMEVDMRGPDTASVWTALDNYSGVNAVNGLGDTSSGDDTINAGFGDDTVYGGAGNDTINGNNNDDVLYGEDGIDSITGGSGNDIIYGGIGNDTLYGVSVTDSASAAADNGNNNFDARAFPADTQGYTYGEDIFGNGSGAYTSGTWTGADGNLANGALSMTLGGVDNANISDMTNYYLDTYNVSSATANTTVKFSYRHIHASQTEVGEDSLVYFYLDGAYTLLNTFAGAAGGGADDDTGWLDVYIDLGSLATGNHTVGFVAWMTAKSASNEDAEFYVDDVDWIERELGTTTGTTNTLYGEDGLDILYGSTETDIFTFEAATAYNNIDEINNFDVLENDQLDISDLITAFNPGTDEIADFVRFTNSGGNTLMQVDADGTGAGSTFQTVAQINGLNDLDAFSLYSAGNLIT